MYTNDCLSGCVLVNDIRNWRQVSQFVCMWATGRELWHKAAHCACFLKKTTTINGRKCTAPVTFLNYLHEHYSTVPFHFSEQQRCIWSSLWPQIFTCNTHKKSNQASAHNLKNIKWGTGKSSYNTTMSICSK